MLWFSSYPAGTTRRQSEPAWYRNARRSRSRARVCLLNFVDSGSGNLPFVRRSTAALEHNDSRSLLPAAARRVLLLADDTLPMAAKQKCSCKRLNKASAQHCGKCGSGWREVDSLNCFIVAMSGGQVPGSCSSLLPSSEMRLVLHMPIQLMEPSIALPWTLNGALQPFGSKFCSVAG